MIDCEFVIIRSDVVNFPAVQKTVHARNGKVHAVPAVGTFIRFGPNAIASVVLRVVTIEVQVDYIPAGCPIVHCESVGSVTAETLEHYGFRKINALQS
jgi:hypothetical protein